jgi:hypothetical protein
VIEVDHVTTKTQVHVAIMLAEALGSTSVQLTA